MANQVHRGLRRLRNATVYSRAGLRSAWRNEEAFRQIGLLCVVSIPAAFWLGDNGAERALLIGSLWLALIVEILNSAVEAVVDRIGLERHELSGRAKDLGSAAVFIALLNALLVWVLLLFD